MDITLVDNINVNYLNKDESKILNNLKQQHKPYFDALMYAVGVLVDRNHKYTGDDIARDVFANFELDAKIQGIDTQETFKQWVAKKTARVMINDKDYGDESFTDSLRDLVNYSLLWIGYIFVKQSKGFDGLGIIDDIKQPTSGFHLRDYRGNVSNTPDTIKGKR